jgi:hypothetical protein
MRHVKKYVHRFPLLCTYNTLAGSLEEAAAHVLCDKGNLRRRYFVHCQVRSVAAFC